LLLKYFEGEKSLILNAILKVVKMNFGSKFQAWVPFYTPIFKKVSRKSGADSCGTLLASFCPHIIYAARFPLLTFLP